MLPLRASAPRPAAGQRDSEGSPAAHMEGLCLRARSTQPRGHGRAHARPQRGAARGSISPRPEGWRRRRRRRRQRQGSGAAGEAGGGGGAGGKPSPLSRRGSRPLPSSSFAAAAAFLLTVPLWLSQPFCPALASRGNSREKEPTGPGPSAGAGARRGARASPPPWAGGGAEVGNSRGDRGTRLQPWRPSPTPPTPQLQETPPLRSGAFSLPPLLPFRQEMVQAPGAPSPLGNQNQASDRQVFRVVLTPRDGAEHPDWSSADCRRC